MTNSVQWEKDFDFQKSDAHEGKAHQSRARAGGFRVATLERLLSWAKSNSLWYTSIGGGCCANEVLSAEGCRYDLERFGCLPQDDPRQVDLLFIYGVVTKKMAAEIRAYYERMPEPRYVIAIGSCANCGGAFGPEFSYSTLAGVDEVVPVDVYVPGCPPRPEAIMNGLLALQDKIRGKQ